MIVDGSWGQEVLLNAENVGAVFSLLFTFLKGRHSESKQMKALCLLGAGDGEGECLPISQASQSQWCEMPVGK